MRRRDANALIGGLIAAAPFATRAQQVGKVPKIGFLYPGPREAVGFRLEAFMNGLNAASEPSPGQVELVVRAANDDQTQIARIVAESVGQKVDAIVAISPAVLLAAHAATRTIPIIAHDLETDPVGMGLAASIARPGGNVTGVFLDFPGFSTKLLQLLKETLPHTSRVAVLWDPGTGSTPKQAIVAAAGALNIELDILEARRPDDFDVVIAANQGKASALLILSSPLIIPNAVKLAELASRHQLPSFTLFPQFARAGGLLAYGPNLVDTFSRVGSIVSKLLRGAKAADVPIEQPAKFEFVINLKTARALDLTVPPSLLARADEVIE